MRPRADSSATSVFAVEDDESNSDDEIDVYEKAARKLVVELRDIDPTPFAGGEAGPWTQAFEDIAGGQWR